MSLKNKLQSDAVVGGVDTHFEPWVDEYRGFEDILELINPQGKFQKRFLYCFLCPLAVLYSLSTSFVYVFYIPKHWCHDPNWSHRYPSYEAWKNATIPTEIGSDGKPTFASCRMLLDNGTESGCRYGWEYDRSELDVTMPSEFNWVCDRQMYITVVFTVSGIAATLGTVVLGPIIDKYGRRRIFVLFAIVDNLAGIVRLFVPRFYPLFLAITIFTSFIGASADIIVQELTDSQFRSWISATIFTVYVFGMAAVPGIVYLIRNWFYIALFAAVPRALFLILIICFFYIPESPRWLISVGRITEAQEVIKKVAKINGTLDNLEETELEASLHRMAAATSKPVGSTPFLGMTKLLSQPRIALNAILLAFALAMNGFVYGGITLNSPYMPGNQFVSFFLLAIIEIPSSILGGWLMQVLGRRWTPAGFFGISAISCFVAAVNVNQPVLMTICIIISKFSINLTSLVAIVQDVEIFPTQFRGTGSSFTGMLSQTLCLGMPTIVSLGRDNASIPYFAFGCCSLIGILCSIGLPETLHQSLPDTLEEANDFAMSQKFWSLRPSRSSRRTRKLKPPPPATSTSTSSPPRRVHFDPSASVRRESVVSFVSQVHPTSSIQKNRRQSVINYFGH